MKIVRAVLIVFALILVPLALQTVYLLLTRGYGLGQELDMIALFVVSAAGSIFLWRVPLDRITILLLILGYVVAMSALLLGYSLLFVCDFFGDCL